MPKPIPTSILAENPASPDSRCFEEYHRSAPGDVMSIGGSYMSPAEGMRVDALCPGSSVTKCPRPSPTPSGSTAGARFGPNLTAAGGCRRTGQVDLRWSRCPDRTRDWYERSDRDRGCPPRARLLRWECSFRPRTRCPPTQPKRGAQARGQSGSESPGYRVE